MATGRPRLTPQEARRFYDRLGRGQDFEAAYQDRALDALVAHAHFDTATAVLELGCGTGRLASRLLAHELPPDARYVGLDVSRRMHDLTRQRLAPFADRVEVVLTDGALQLPFEDAAFDRFVATYVLDLLSPEDITLALSEAARVVRPGKSEAADPGGCDGEGIGQAAGRGTFTKEYMSLALREGWGDFVTIWTWNARTENDCTRQKPPGSKFVDFNLDGSDDNNEANDDYDHMYDCHGTPFVHHDTALPMDNTNWLDDLQDTAYAHHCDREPDDDVEANRSTVYDVAKMFWQLNHTNGQNVPIEDLVDLYVDMCPRRWAINDSDADADGVYVEDDLPLERLKISAAANGLTTELNAVLDHVEH